MADWIDVVKPDTDLNGGEDKLMRLGGTLVRYLKYVTDCRDSSMIVRDISTDAHP